MKLVNFSFLRHIALLLIAGGLGILASPLTTQAQAQAQPEAQTPAADTAKGQGQTILIQSGSYTEDLHRAFMAIKLAMGLQEKGAQVILFLNLESARAADTTVPNNIVWGSGEPYSHYYEGFVKAGGKVLVCPHCAMAAGITQENLREGAKIAEFGEVTDAILEADKILDY